MKSNDGTQWEWGQVDIKKGKEDAGGREGCLRETWETKWQDFGKERKKLQVKHYMKYNVHGALQEN